MKWCFPIERYIKTVRARSPGKYYFGDALKSILEAEVETFTQSMSDMNEYELAKYTSNAWRTAFSSEQTQTLKLESFKLSSP